MTDQENKTQPGGEAPECALEVEYSVEVTDGVKTFKNAYKNHIEAFNAFDEYISQGVHAKLWAVRRKYPEAKPSPAPTAEPSPEAGMPSHPEKHCLDKAFPISSITREMINEAFNDKYDAEKITDEDMEDIADYMSTWFAESWHDALASAIAERGIEARNEDEGA